MTRNDRFFKILFAIEIALLPLVMAANFILPTWTMSLFVLGILVSKIWMSLFKNKEDRAHAIINAVGNALIISTLTIFFTIQGYIESLLVCVLVVVFAVLSSIFKIALFNAQMPEIVDAVDSCNGLFGYFVFAALVVVVLRLVATTQLILNVSLFAFLLTAIVSSAYKTYYVFRNYNVLSKIKTFFANLFRRRETFNCSLLTNHQFGVKIRVGE